MSDNTKLKKLARARQRITGEAYSTALLHVRGPVAGGGLEQRVRALLPLVAASKTEDRELARRYGVERVLKPDTSNGDAYLNAPRPKGEALKDAIRSFDMESKLKVLAIMYAGRDDDDDIRGGFDYLVPVFPEPEHVVEQLVQKIHLHEFLEKGLALAAQRGVNLDERWPMPAARLDPGRATPEHIEAYYADLAVALDGARSWKRRPWLPRDEHDPARLRRTWASREGVKESTGHRCLTRLVMGRCNLLDCEHLPGRDHSSMWNKDGRPDIFVTQPYHLRDEVVHDMLQTCRRLGLQLRIDSALAWHAPEAVLVEVLRGGGPR